MSTLHSLGIGVATQNAAQEIIEVFYPAPLHQPELALVHALADAIDYKGANQTLSLDSNDVGALANTLKKVDPAQSALLRTLAESKAAVIVCLLAEDKAPTCIAEVFLKLHLLSHRLCLPHSLNLQGAFGVLRNLAWTNEGPIELGELAQRQLQARAQGRLLDVQSVDKFPKMTNYVVPAGVRIADTARVRLGAYVGEGTTVMHEGFINFNAGTHGTAMIEGRISAGVVIGEGSDLGGGCSTMGTLSGGGTQIISVGRDCLIGANAGIGIALGDRCVIEAGLYVTAGTKVQLLDEHNKPVRVIKALELNGQSDLLFRRNSQSGAVECKANRSTIALNDELHSNN